MQSNDLLTRAECNLLRGLAILGIFLHNYCHWLSPVVKENEYQWFERNVNWFDQVLATPDALLPMHIVSYLGHYGVPIFLFLSAYGLERKYGQGPRLTIGSYWIGAWDFVWKHYKKLFKMMAVGLTLFIIVDAMTLHRWHYTVTQLLCQITMTGNWLPDPDKNIWPGPYWYFGLMLQLYIVYRLVLYRRHWGWTVGLMAVCCLGQLFMEPESDMLNYYRYNFMGGMLPFGFGLLFARFGEKVLLVRLSPLAMAMSAVVCTIFLVTMLHNYIGWCLAPLLVCGTAIYWVKLLTVVDLPWLTTPIYNMLSWLGNISAALFVTHPLVRKVIIPISRGGDMWTGLLLYIIAALGVAWMVNRLLKSEKHS